MNARGEARILAWRAVSFQAILGGAAIMAAIFTLGFVPLRSSFDEWWHLKSGRYIVENGLPKHDVFTYTASELEWHNHEWLAQAGLWKVFEAGERRGWGGIRTVQLLKTGYLIGAYLMLMIWLSRRGGGAAVAGLAVMLAVGLSRRTLYFRPPFLTYGILIGVLIVLMRWREGGKRRHGPLMGLPPVFALWANLHGGFMAGLVFVGAFWAEAVADVALARWRREDAKAKASAAFWMTGVLAACFGATLVNPYTWHLYELAVRVMGDRELVGIIYELLPPDWNYVWIVDGVMGVLVVALVRPGSARGWTVALAAVALLVLKVRVVPVLLAPWMDGGAAGAWTRELIVLALMTLCAVRAAGRVGVAVWGLNVFFAHQAIQHVRHLPLWGIVLAPLVAACLTDWMRGDATRFVETPAEARGRQARERWMPRMATGMSVFLACHYLLAPGEWVHSLPSILGQPGAYFARPLAGTNLARNLELMRGNAVQERDYPIRAVDHLIEARLPGRIWNAANYAGYLIWRLSPEKHKVFTDTRYDIWGGKFLLEEAVVRDGFGGDKARGVPSWNSVLDTWSVNTIFIPVRAGLHDLLARESGDSGAAWRLDYLDEAYAIWTRRNPIDVSERAR